MVGVQVAKEFDGRVYIGEVIASVPPEEDEEPATLAATRAPVVAGGGGSGGSVGGGGGGAGLDAPGDILLTPPRVRPRASSGGGGSGASASPAGPAEKRRRVGIASIECLTTGYSGVANLPRRRRTQSQPPATDEPTDTDEAGSPESDEPGQVQVESWGSWTWKVRRALCLCVE